MDQITHDVRRDNWLAIIQQCQARPENITVKQWLADNDIKDKAYYYWLRKFRKEAYAEMHPPLADNMSAVTFAEVHLPMPAQNTSLSNVSYCPVAVIKYKGISLEISNEISAPLLQTLIREVKHA